VALKVLVTLRGFRGRCRWLWLERDENRSSRYEVGQHCSHSNDDTYRTPRPETGQVGIAVTPFGRYAVRFSAELQIAEVLVIFLFLQVVIAVT